MSHRRGTVLIVTVGIATLLASLGFAFLATTRVDRDEVAGLMATTQARAMLSAALQYVDEAARLGWDDSDSASRDPLEREPKEAFGWRDVRDGTVGPKDQWGRRLFSAGDDGRGPTFPAIGGVARCPTWVMRRPPYAITPDVELNPLTTDPATGLPDPTKPWASLVAFPNHDPQPAATTFADFARGDPSPRPGSAALAWFRVYREDVTTFILACGAGATQGFRDWTEAAAADGGPPFASREEFEDLRSAETILWYRCEWSASVGGSENEFYDAQGGWYSINLSPLSAPINATNCRQFVGTFRYVERIFAAPDAW